METRKMTHKTGLIRYRRELITVSAALGGWSVGLGCRTGEDILDVWFGELLVGQLDPSTGRFHAALPGGMETAETEEKLETEV